MDAQPELVKELVVTPRLLALLDERERQNAEDLAAGRAKPLEQILDEIFGPEDSE